MLAPAFYYTIDLSGTTTSVFVDKTWNVNTLRIHSEIFSSDLDAISSLKTALDNLISMQLDLTNAEEVIDFNPDFFPQDLTREQLTVINDKKDEAFMLEDDASDTLSDENKIAIIVTEIFDPEGDNINLRWTIKNEKFSIVAKVATHLDFYLEQKALKKMYLKDSYLCFKSEFIDKPIIFN